jgi:hypothetical protein
VERKKVYMRQELAIKRNIIRFDPINVRLGVFA